MAKASGRSTTKTKRGADDASAKATTGSAAVNLDSLDRDALLQLQKDVDRALRTFEKRKREEALVEMEAVAKRHGLSLKDVVQSGPKQGLAVPKFRHPENSALTWSGRGRQPAWYKAAIKAGADPEDLKVA